MDTIPDHVRDRIICSNGAVDWMTEECIRRGNASPESDKHTPNTRGQALRYAWNTLQVVLAARLAAVSDRM